MKARDYAVRKFFFTDDGALRFSIPVWNKDKNLVRLNICIAMVLVVTAPMCLLIKKFAPGVSAPVMTVAVMTPAVYVILYKKNGLTFGKTLKVRARALLRPKIRPYKRETAQEAQEI